MGWLTPITEMLEHLVEEQGNTPALRITQIKQKWGYLRVYGDDFSEQADAIVEEAEEKTAATCDICGAPGEPDNVLRSLAVNTLVHFSQRGSTNFWSNQIINNN